MQVKNPEILSVIEAIASHYRTNISNRFTRRALTTMSLDAQSWVAIEELTEHYENYRYQGYHLDELYSQILAIARFVYQARKQVAPNLRFMASSGGQAHVTEADRVFKEMAINNFSSNLKILADKINELYMKAVAIDKEYAGQTAPVFGQIPELRELGRYLVE